MENWNNSDELAELYANDLKRLIALYNLYRDLRQGYLELQLQCENDGQWDKSLEYKQLRKEIRLQMKIIGPIVSSSRYSIRWLKTGNEPKSGHPVSRLSYTQRTVSVSDVDQALTYLNHLKTDYREMTDDERAELDIFLNGMSTREREVFVSVRGKRNTFEMTAEYLNISKSAVQEYLKRAESKILKTLDNNVQTSLF